MKTLLLFSFLTVLLSASEGEALFDQHCLHCHIKEKMDLSTFKEHKQELKAPPMNLVIKRLKKVITISVDDEDVKQAVITAYIKDYVQAPSIDKGLCRVGCFVQFGEMPRVSEKISAHDLHTVSTWAYENY